MATQALVRTLSDGWVSVEVDDTYDGTADEWTGHVRFSPRRTGRTTTDDLWALELAPLSSLPAGVASVGGRQRERFALTGGEMVIFDCADLDDARWAAWLGPWHMAHGLFYAPQWDSADIVETFQRVRWNDTPDGMTGDIGQRFNLQRAVYVLPFAHIGTMLIEAQSRAADRIPKWRGFQGRAGEIWRLPPQSGEGPESLLLVTGSALVTLNPWKVPSRDGRGGTGAGTTAEAAEFLSSVRRVDWVD